MQFLEKVAVERGQLLRVETQIDGPMSEVISALMLTFDIGRILLRADSASGSLDEQLVEANAAMPSNWVNADTLEPWWRVLGSPLSRVLEIAGGSGSVGVALQFRQDGDNPRRIALLVHGTSLVVKLQPPAA